MEEQRFENEERQKATRKIRDEYAEQAWQEALVATAEQWQAIRPKLARIRQLRSMPGYGDLCVRRRRGRQLPDDEFREDVRRRTQYGECLRPTLGYPRGQLHLGQLHPIRHGGRFRPVIR